jgi:ketosteroid isomerase-like protein
MESNVNADVAHPPAHTDETGGPMRSLDGSPAGRQAFAAYVKAFNSGDIDAFTGYYADDIEMVLPSGTLPGLPAIRAFYTKMFAAVRESLHVHHLVADGEGLAIEATTRFTALRDAPDLPMGPLVAGEAFQARYFILYRLRTGRISRIEAARVTPLAGPFRVTDATPAGSE